MTPPLSTSIGTLAKIEENPPQTELSKTGGRYAARANYNHNLWYGNSALPLVYRGLNIAAVFCAARKSEGAPHNSLLLHLLLLLPCLLLVAACDNVAVRWRCVILRSCGCSCAPLCEPLCMLGGCIHMYAPGSTRVCAVAVVALRLDRARSLTHAS